MSRSGVAVPAEVVLALDGAVALPPEAGGKARGLERLVRAGLAVPPAWVVLPGAADGVVAALGRALAARGHARLAVRSSAVDEDGVAYSFAGVHTSRLAVPATELVAAVHEVAASTLAPRAAAYRRQHGLPAAPGPCAVVIQALVDAEWAGVAFGRAGGVLVEAVEGLGETAVDGDATPEAIEVEPTGAAWSVARRWPRRQAFAVRAAAPGLSRAALAGIRPEVPAGVAIAVAAGVAALERTGGAPLDVEWAARDGAVTFLQARPQTRPLDAALPPGETWTRTNVRELMPELVSALGASLTLPALDRYFSSFLRAMGVPAPDGVPLVTVIAGRAVANERTFCSIADAVGVPRSWTQVLQGAPGEATNALAPPDLRRMLRRLDVVLRLAAFGAGAERKARRHLAGRSARRERRLRVPAAALTDDALVARVREATGSELAAVLDVVNRVLVAFNQALASAAMAVRHHPAPAALVARLVDPELVSVTTRQLEDLVELARAIRRRDGAFLREAPAAREEWQAALGPDLWTRVEAWLAAYGHRGPYESEPALPRLAEDLSLLATALRPLVDGTEPDAPAVTRARRHASFAAAWREVAARGGWLARLRARGPVRKLGRLAVLREEVRSEWMRDWATLRVDLVELGRRLVSRGSLDAPGDVFRLDADALARALRDPGFDARSAVARDRARAAAWRRIVVPNRFTTEDVAAFGRTDASAIPARTAWRGTAVSPGEAEGRACVLRSPHDAPKLEAGGILVAPATDPGWTPLFARAAAVVVELGGVMSHSATVAREFGLPCVSNVEGATVSVRDGDLLRVDGTRGTVERLARCGGAEPGTLPA